MLQCAVADRGVSFAKLTNHFSLIFLFGFVGQITKTGKYMQLVQDIKLKAPHSLGGADMGSWHGNFVFWYFLWFTNISFLIVSLPLAFESLKCQCSEDNENDVLIVYRSEYRAHQSETNLLFIFVECWDKIWGQNSG